MAGSNQITVVRCVTVKSDRYFCIFITLTMNTGAAEVSFYTWVQCYYITRRHIPDTRSGST
jgi:hypothetical protein